MTNYKDLAKYYDEEYEKHYKNLIKLKNMFDKTKEMAVFCKEQANDCRKRIKPVLKVV